MTTVVDNRFNARVLSSWGDGIGGFWGQSFVAQDSLLKQVEFEFSSWSGGTTDYKVVIVAYDNSNIGAVVGSSELRTVSTAGTQTINFDGVPLVAGQTYAFLLDTTFGTSNEGFGAFYSNRGVYTDGGVFFNLNENNGQPDYSSEITPNPSNDLSFKLVFDSPPPPIMNTGTKNDDVFVATSNSPQAYNGLAGNDSITTFGGNDTIDGGLGDDTIRAGGGDDTITGGKGNDTLYGESGNDVFLLGTSAGLDTIVGGDGYDTIRATADGTLFRWNSISEIEEVSAGGFGGAKIVGSKDADTFDFSAVKLTGIAAIEGSNGDDTIIGSAGDDIISGGVGADVLTGGAGYDTFVYEATVASRPGVSLDRITDFEDGIDKIDLSAIDANTALAGTQAFTFIGDGAFTGAKGELHYTYVGGDTHVSANLGGDLKADFEIVLSGMHTLSSGDFLFG
jgi:Ca2+-binding RTX toxin-like protein